MTRVRFAGNEFFPDEVLSLRVRTRPNRRFLGIPGFTWWVWFYRLGASGAVGERLGQALMAGGEAPAYLDTTVVAADTERLRLFYHQEGFRQVDVRARIDTLDRRDRVQVTFRIRPGPPTYIRRVAYDLQQALNTEQRRRLIGASVLAVASLTPGDSGFVASEQRYSAPVLLEERRRILGFLRDEGFALAARDSIRAIVLAGPPDSLDIVFRIRPGARYRFGAVRAHVVGPEDRAPARRDTLAVGPARLAVSMQDESILDPAVIRRALRFTPGDWYDQSLLVATKRRLDATGVFTFTDILPVWEDTSRLATQHTPMLPHRIELRTRRRHGIRLETFVLQRSGVLGSSDSETGMGVGVSYQNANLLGGGETFELRTAGSIAGDFVSDSSLAAQAEVSGALAFPYLVWPFRALDRRLGLYDARTRLTLSLLTARRDELKLIIRGRGLARMRLEMDHSPTITSLLDVVDVSISNPDTLSGFKASFLDAILDDSSVVDPVQRAQILEDYTQPQANTAVRYTFRSSRVDPLRRNQGYSYESAFEVGGNALYLLDRFVFTPSTLEGTLPGLPIFRGDRLDNRLVYRQYVRLVGDFRRYTPVGRRGVVAWKAVVGAAHPTGKSDVIPFDRRFYSGGPTSVRGWSLRELGPGAVGSLVRSDSAGGASANLLGGDIKLEGSLEYRNTILRTLFAADWMGVLFLDAGNVWIGPRNPGRNPQDPEGRFRFDSLYREIGIGTGMGLRIAWEYLIVRLDFGVKVFDPSRRAEGLFPDGLRDIRPYFGIGHTF